MLTVPETFPAAGAVIFTVGDWVSGGLFTVTTMSDDVAIFPAASLAFAVIVYSPLATLNVFHEKEYGAATSSGPRLFPLSKNCTPATPVLSLASAVILIVPKTSPADGAVILIVG